MDFNNIHQNVRHPSIPFPSVIDCEWVISKGRSVIRRRGCSNNDDVYVRHLWKPSSHFHCSIQQRFMDVGILIDGFVGNLYMDHVICIIMNFHSFGWVLAKTNRSSDFSCATVCKRTVKYSWLCGFWNFLAHDWSGCKIDYDFPIETTTSLLDHWAFSTLPPREPFDHYSRPARSDNWIVV